jgi:hypothetical protein
MSHSTPIQDPNTPYGLNLGRPLNEASNTQFDQNQYANTQHSSSGVRDPSQAMYSEGAQYAREFPYSHPSCQRSGRDSDGLSFHLPPCCFFIYLHPSPL